MKKELLEKRQNLLNEIHFKDIDLYSIQFCYSERITRFIDNKYYLYEDEDIRTICYDTVFEILNDFTLFFDISDMYTEVENIDDNLTIEEQENIILDILSRLKDFSIKNHDNLIKQENKLKEEIDELLLEINEIDYKLKHYEDEYLQDLLSIAMNELRKKAFPYKRRLFIYHDVKIVSEEMKSNTCGYVSVEDFLNDEVIIHINRKYLIHNNELTTCNRKKFQRRLNKTIINVIKHELIHAYTYFKYDNRIFKDVHLNFYKDSSIIFMSYVLWFNNDEENGYDSFRQFKETDFYRKVMNCKSFDEVEILCMSKAQTLAEEVRNHSTYKSENKLIHIIPSFADFGKWNEDIVLRKKETINVDNKVQGYLYFVELNNMCDKDYKHQVKFLLEDELTNLQTV